jgi:hypothetical protein
MTAKEYRRWALASLRERAMQRGIEVAGRKDQPRLLLAQRNGLLLSYQEDWWRSAFKRSGYGGFFAFECEHSDPESKPAIVLLMNLRKFFIPMRSPENLEQVDYFIDRLLRLSRWCIDEKLEEFSTLAREAGTALSKVERAAKTLREFMELPDAQS